MVEDLVSMFLSLQAPELPVKGLQVVLEVVLLVVVVAVQIM